MCGKLFAFCVLLFAVLFGLFWHKSYPVPQLEDEWWASGSPKAVDESIRPFSIEVPDEILVDLKSRLQRAQRMSPALEGVGFEYGFNSKHMSSVLDYWMNQYDWKKQESYLNSFPHFKTNIGGLDIHFIRKGPEVKTTKKVLPLLMLHGWPGSFVEFLKIIPMLTVERPGYNFVFEVIVASLPGYGFSDPARKPGMGPAEMGHVFDQLMKRLGYQQYYIQGGDWGSLIGTAMATIYPQRIKGLHLSMLGFSNLGSNIGLGLGSLWPTMLLPADKVDLVYPLKEKFGFVLRETGYMHLQATKPDTVGIALSDSPVGLAAYIMEKFSTWTNRERIGDADGGLTHKFTMDELLTNVMVYWVTNSITSSMRLYKEAFSSKTLGYHLDDIICVVPTGAAIFPQELFIQPEPLVKFKFSRLISYTFMERGGHFAAFEEPQLLSDDVWKFTSLVEAD
nr:juvenile hormone epoxide hydrolase 1 [Diaphanosoma celebensis]